MSFMTESGEMQFNNQYIIKNFIVRQSSSLKANDKDYKQHLNALVEKKKKTKTKTKKTRAKLEVPASLFTSDQSGNNND